MKLRNMAFLALLTASGTASANFCAIDNYGNSMGCNFITLQQCQQYIRNRGACTVQAQTQQAQQIYTPDIAGAYQQGQRARAERQEAEARTALLRAQEEEVRQRMQPDAAVCPNTVLYKCPTEDGKGTYTADAAPGCVVVATAQK